MGTIELRGNLPSFAESLSLKVLASERKTEEDAARGFISINLIDVAGTEIPVLYRVLPSGELGLKKKVKLQLTNECSSKRDLSD